METEITVDVRLKGGWNTGTIEIVLTPDDIRKLAEEKAKEQYACDSCVASRIKYSMEEA